MPFSGLLVTEGLAGVTVTSAITLISSAAVTTVSKNWESPVRMRMVLSIGCGYLLGLVLFELLPDVYRYFDGNMLITGVLVGMGFLLGLLVDCYMNQQNNRRIIRASYPLGTYNNHRKFATINLTHKACCAVHTTHNMAAETVNAAMACIGLCVFFDGVTFSATMLGSGRISDLAFIGVLGHVVPEVVLVGILARSQKHSRSRAMLFCTFATLAFIFGNILAQFAGYFGVPDGILLGLASGMVAYVSLSHLIPKVSSGRQERIFATIGLLFFCLTKVLNH